MKKRLGHSRFLAALPLYVGLFGGFLQAEAPRDLPPPVLSLTPVKPRECVEVEPGHLFIDFGRVGFGYLELRLTQPQDGTLLQVHLAEKLQAPHTLDRKPGGSIRYLSTTVTLKAGQELYRVALPAADERLMPKAIGAVMPFRYVQIDGAPPSLRAEQITQQMVHAPFDETVSHFNCSNPQLNAVWELCKYSMKATSFAGLMVDGDRERKPYEADAFINQLGWYYTAGDIALPRRTHEYLITHPTWPTEWILFSVLIAWEDYLYSGDASSLEHYFTDLQAKTLLALARPDGLISVPNAKLPPELGKAIHIDKIRDLVDWPPGERDGYEMKPINTVANVFHARALDRMAKIAGVLGKTALASEYRLAAEKVTRSINDKLFDPATGLYLDAEGSTHSSIHANLFALAFGCVPPERQQAVTAYLVKRGMACSVYGSQFLLDALFDADQATVAQQLMIAPGDRSWRHMIETVGTSITLEAWDNRYKPNQDWNHAWGAAPANVIPRKLMGIEPLEAGWKKLQIRPRLGDLAWAEIKTPTPLGAILVRAEKNPGYRLKLKLPAPALVYLPTQDPQSIREASGISVKLLRMEKGAAVLDLPAGTYDLRAP